MVLPRVIVLFLALPGLAGCQQGPILFHAGNRPAAQVHEAPSFRCADDPAIAVQLDAAVNAARRAEGKTVLDSDPLLGRIAQSHACDMATMGRLSVEGSDGSSVVDRARAVRYPACGVVQLVWRGGSAAGAVANWLARDAQRIELLGQPSRQIGSGFAVGADGAGYHSVVLGDDCR